MSGSGKAPLWPIATLPLERDDDVVHARQCARVLSQRLGFGGQDQTRIATALSEIARNALGYAGGGKVEFMLAGVPDRCLVVRVRDHGGGIADLPRILDGRYRSSTGMGLGITGARRLMDRLHVASSTAGTTVDLVKVLPDGAQPTTASVTALSDAVRTLRAANPGTAARDENRDLAEALATLAEREEEAQRLNRELEETNRGVVALHAELERKAEELLRAGETLERQVAARTRELADANVRLLAEAEARERIEADLRQSQKMEAVGQLTGGIAHDFNNMLAAIVGALDMIQRRLKQGRHERLDSYIDMALSSANRAAALTHRLLAFARRQPLDPKIVDVNALVAGMADLLRRTVNKSVTICFKLDPIAWTTLCDPSQLENAILNLVINARDAMPDGGRIDVTTRNATVAAGDSIPAAPGDYVVMRVADTGTGMPPEVLARAFDPFFTTKPIGQGTGLGLSMIYGFARQSEGCTVITSMPGEGTAIDIILPRHEGEVVIHYTAAAEAGAESGRGETVLLVEDETGIRDLLREALFDAGYIVCHASNGTQGLAIARAEPRLDLLVTDVGLPGLNGRQLADAVREFRPGLKVLFVTGYAGSAASPSDFLGSGMSILAKPFDIGALLARMRGMLDD